MKLAVFSNPRSRVLSVSLFILIWMSNFVKAGTWLPLYLLLGISGIFCLWQRPQSFCLDEKTTKTYFAVSCLFSLTSILLNLSVFAPVYALLSISNMTMSALGGALTVYQILLYVRFCQKNQVTPEPRLLLPVFLMILWLILLRRTDSRFSVYIFCAVAGVICLCHNRRQAASLPRKTEITLAVFAGLFSLATVLSNYSHFTPFFHLPTMLRCGVCLLGGICAGYQVLLAMMIQLPAEGKENPPREPFRVFWRTVIPVCVICGAYLFSSCYPGLLTRDSQSTVEQILGIQPYNNTMPFWHTVTVLPFFKLGMALTGTTDGGIALFHCTQILFMAACFGSVMVTLYQIAVPRYALMAVGFLYACIPYNIVYSVTLWKDVPFSGAALLFAVGLYRLLKNVGKSRKLNYFLLIFGALGFSLWRTNGWYAFLATTLVMALLLGKKQWKLLVIMALVLILCWVLINPVLDGLEVSETNLVEAFAVPMQQVARVVACERPLTEYQTEMLSSIFWLDRMAELYNPLSVDPIKFLTFRNDQIHCITENPMAYVKLYLELGLQYPADYLKAWVNETKGYWNGGYDYWLYDLGYDRNIHNPIEGLFVSLFRFLNETEVLKLFSSAGLYVWGMIGCCLVNLLKKREEFLLSIPMLVLVVGLWLGTPVFCEFRYAYPVILTLPFIACVTMYKKRDVL